MASNIVSVPGFGEITPFKQGNLSNLCGLYTVLNAIKLAIYPQAPSRRVWAELYAIGINFLARRYDLEVTFTEGMPMNVWKELFAELCDEAQPLLGRRLLLRPIRRAKSMTANKIEACVLDALNHRRLAACLFDGALDHYSVIAGATQTRWMLFDSSSHQWVARKNVDWGIEADAPHFVGHKSVLLLWTKDEI